MVCFGIILAISEANWEGCGLALVGSVGGSGGNLYEVGLLLVMI